MANTDVVTISFVACMEEIESLSVKSSSCREELLDILANATSEFVRSHGQLCELFPQMITPGTLINKSNRNILDT